MSLGWFQIFKAEFEMITVEAEQERAIARELHLQSDRADKPY
jgi:hypothetical protein